MVTCTVHDKNNNRDIKHEIFFDKGDGQKPIVVIYRPDAIHVESESDSLVCEVSSPKLGNVYIMWKVGDGPYIKGSTSAPIHQKQQPITCAVIHVNMDNMRAPLQVSTSQSKEKEVSCD